MPGLRLALFYAWMTTVTAASAQLKLRDVAFAGLDVSFRDAPVVRANGEEVYLLGMTSEFVRIGGPRGQTKNVPREEMESLEFAGGLTFRPAEETLKEFAARYFREQESVGKMNVTFMDPALNKIAKDGPQLSAAQPPPAAPPLEKPDTKRDPPPRLAAPQPPAASEPAAPEPMRPPAAPQPVAAEKGLNVPTWGLVAAGVVIAIVLLWRRD